MAGVQIPQSTSRVVMLKLFLSSDHVSAATGKTLAIVISKNGGAFGNPNAGATNATEVSAGWYKVTMDTTDTNTVGDLVVRGTAASCDDVERIFAVVKATNAGLTALPDTAVTTNASLLTSGSGTDQLLVSSGKVVTPDTQKVDVNTIKTQTVTCSAGVTVGAFVGNATAALTVDASGRVQIQVGTSTGQINSSSGKVPATLASTDVTGNVAADVQTIKTQTVTCAAGVTVGAFVGQGTAAIGVNASGHVSRVTLVDTTTTNTDMITQANVRSAVGLASANLDTQLAAIAGYIDTEVAAIKAKTDNLPASPAATSDCITAAGVRSAVGLASANLDTQLAAIPGLVWDVSLAGHVTAGSTGEKLNAAGSAGDPWTTALPGSYTAGQAGYIVGNNLNATVSSRAATGDAMALTSGERNSVADALLDRTDAIETGITPRLLLRYAGAAVAGTVSGGGTTTEIFTGIGVATTRITATVDGDGNRSAITLG